jgi:transcriptional regulator with PAS, ATPase and Fis domain
MTNDSRPKFNLQSVLDSHVNPFVVIDENYTIVEANRAYCDHYDTSPTEIVGAKCHMIHHNSESPCHTYGEECPLQKVLETGDRYEVCHIHHNQQYHPECVSIKGFPIIDENGKRYLGEEIIQDKTKSGTTGENAIKSVEARHIAQLLEEYHGHRRKVAEILKISERTLYRKLVKFNLTDVGKIT